ncbi:MAG: bifunctional 5,10-methylenetetrahydrofolate dehydrogenase/5,10-methenyltetrahydrofolate cyclohydrolase [Actinomycetota bacterium]|jgi:methylenetetrahydrofolate dehydrogenase (NADP+)/methenyltetrahydrofolate cyclohydrolase|nr:bifunctional 5,10-methylenetetrahydrofolate dehydrogenase/5,10-methenyltetrahydrofolate cyclohydrolase [Actinomycetota bacterium]|tara:strand:+ start:471 stop:1307 length:837 start_codon:yes stop_codon:yes gene_type:complete
MSQILYGKPVAENLDFKSKTIFENYTTNNDKPPVLTAITVGENPASLLYVSVKEKKAKLLGVDFNWIKLKESTLESELEDTISEYSESSQGMIVQLPLPEHLNVEKVIDLIPSEIDVDGLTTFNLGRLYSENLNIIPATSMAILELLSHYEIETEDKNIVIAGRSRLVTSPLSKILSSKKFNGNVSVIHSKTSNPKDFVSKADIFISAVGKSKMFDKSYFKEGSYVIDVGISVVDGKSYGDIDTADLDNYLLGRAPYPGGIGPITVSALYSNLAQLIS